MTIVALSRRSALLGAASLATAAAAPTPLTFAGLYGPVTADGIQLTPAAEALVGRKSICAASWRRR